jgi:hypothetical protein
MLAAIRALAFSYFYKFEFSFPERQFNGAGGSYVYIRLNALDQPAGSGHSSAVQHT